MRNLAFRFLAQRKHSFVDPPHSKLQGTVAPSAGDPRKLPTSQELFCRVRTPWRLRRRPHGIFQQSGGEVGREDFAASRGASPASPRKDFAAVLNKAKMRRLQHRKVSFKLSSKIRAAVKLGVQALRVTLLAFEIPIREWRVAAIESVFKKRHMLPAVRGSTST